MSITVIITRGDTGAPTTREVYAEGVKFNIENGELGIISDRPQLVALYGSGNWLSVHVDDHVVVVTDKPDDSDSDSDSSGDLDFSSFDTDDTSDDSDSSTDSDDATEPTEPTEDVSVEATSTE